MIIQHDSIVIPILKRFYTIDVIFIQSQTVSHHCIAGIDIVAFGILVRCANSSKDYFMCLTVSLAFVMECCPYDSCIVLVFVFLVALEDIKIALIEEEISETGISELVCIYHISNLNGWNESMVTCSYAIQAFLTQLL